ncbi:MAG: MBG domain-containing protein [Chitinispirillia bacterium]|nr:MBG domain-containing protein [Chitinispirillia bacterium]MCL2241226.1 MBG domain-containing protein [Chitinispirillia bacterium]
MNKICRFTMMAVFAGILGVTAEDKIQLKFSNLEYTYNGHRQALTPASVKEVDTLCVDGDFKFGYTSDSPWTETIHGVPSFKDAGKYRVYVKVEKDTCYGNDTATLTIKPAVISIDPEKSVVKSKPYDGTDSAEIESVAFKTVGYDEPLKKGIDYTLAGTKFASINVSSSGVTAQATVTLVGNGPISKNYTLSNIHFSKTGAFITKVLPEIKHLSYTIPPNLRQIDKGQPIIVGTDPFYSGMGTITVGHRHILTDKTEEKPIVSGTYEVIVGIAEGTNFINNKISLGHYTIHPPAKSISGAAVTVWGEYIYNGSGRRPGLEDGTDVTVEMPDGTILRPETDYKLSHSNNTDAGTNAIVTVTGLDEYTGTVSKAFTIERRNLTVDDLKIKNTVTYNGAPQPMAVEVAEPMKGLGAVTVRYGSGVTFAPQSVGIYMVAVEVPSSVNFNAVTIGLGTYEILKKVPSASDFVFTIPQHGHIYNGLEQGIGSVAMKGTGYGDITLFYNGQTELPVEIGSYEVRASVTDGDNYQAISRVYLGDYSIIDPEKSVADGGKFIPADINDGAIAAPAGPMTVQFTAGPNPAGRGSGAVNFYRRGKQIKGGVLTIFDASGNAVGKIQINDRESIGNTARRWVGSWNLRDSKGRQVAGGTYLVRGEIRTKSGDREQVSVLVGVR